MAAEKSSRQVRDMAIEALLAEIVNTAHRTGDMLRYCNHDDVRTAPHLVRQLEQTVAQLGWTADLALHRMDSMSSLHAGRAECWLFSPVCLRALEALD